MKVEGTGSIEQLEKKKPKGKCRKWRLWVRAEGRNYSKRFSGTYREAQKELEDFKAKVEAVVPNAETFAAYAQSWADYRRDSGSFDPNTVAKDSRHVRALSRVLGGMSMDSITPEVCRDALSRIKNGENASGKTLTNTTMEGMHVAMHLIMQQAEDDGKIASNPMRKVKLPRRDTLEREALSPAGIEALLDGLDGLPPSAYVMACYLMACLGLRRGEACALMDADVHDGFARVRYAVKESDGSIGRPKSRAGIRTLPVPPRLEAKIAEWRAHRDANGLHEAPTLACNVQGGVLRPQNLARWWRGDAKHEGVRGQLGCPDMVLHELRHSNLSMVARHLSPFDLQRYAGWSSLEPARVYIHEDMQSVVAGVGDAWEGMA